MTVAIAAFAGPGGPIVTVSDARLSFDEIIPAADEATMKNRRFASKWGVMFAATDATAFDPVVRACSAELGYSGVNEEKLNFSLETIIDTVRRSYEAEFNERFFREHLSRFGYADIKEWRRNAHAEMGKDLYHQYSMELAKFDLGLELLVYGFDDCGNHHLFEVASPGKIIQHNSRGYAAIGSGLLMAIAALNRKPLTLRLPEVVYRLLDAKFSSETANYVGKKTYVIVMYPSGKFEIMPQHEIEKIRTIWNEEQKKPEPSAAIELINTSRVITSYRDD
jgi:20S proteasome alpha/beta subunit